jgi:hypothetical protein
MLTHPLLHIISCSKHSNGKQLFHIYKNKSISFSEEVMNEIEETFSKGLGTKTQPLQLTQTECEDLIKKLDIIIEKHGNQTDSEYSDDEEETIQTVLARRIKRESKGKIIEEEVISDSENEDVISNSRRLRYLYKEIKCLKEQINNIK